MSDKNILCGGKYFVFSSHCASQCIFRCASYKKAKKGLSLKVCVISKRPINLLGITLEMGENSYVFDFFVRCWIGGKYEWEPRRLGLADRKRLKKWIHIIWTKNHFRNGSRIERDCPVSVDTSK